MAQQDVILKLKGVADFSDIKGNISTLQNYLKNLKLPTDITKKIEGSFSKLDKELETFQQHLNSGFKTKGDVTGLEKSGQRIVAEFEKIESTIEGIDTSKLRQAFQIDTSKLTQAQEKINQLRNTIQQKYSVDIKINDSGNKLNGQIVNIQQSLDKLYSSSKSKKLIDFKNAINSGDVAAIKSQLTELENYGNTVFTKDTENAKNFKSAVMELSGAFNTLKSDELNNLSQQLNLSEQEAEELKKNFESLRTQAVQDLSSGVKGMTTAQEKLNGELLEGAKNSQTFNDELNQVQSQVQYFFSLVNVAQLLRRALQDVIETVKTLDAAMTETAVVTDFTVSDMWDKLPEYTASAKALGVVTHELYEATTLYYQQGLDTNASMAAGIETMKMAKIAGMEAAQATDAMTAALRGFNMEVNETNAQRVNDVYSELAAITASDTEEIATAMSKTASIASSVGAEFENIAVFLAQAIETTRESADSIGTAMKTVLARFNELTKDPAEIMEVDGEIVDANKVDAALKSVGISLLDVNKQFRDADEVLLEVAQKWDSMTTMQQRYIATQAAGSRQQSRFIAMMSDYNRTLELQTAAYNSEGAAQAQYEKTLESLESKLNKLKDTWDEFILGIANNDAIKAGVDALSKLLDVINKMTNAPGILGGVLKSLLAFGVFKGGKTLVNSLFAGYDLGKKGIDVGKSFSAGFTQGFSKSIKSSGKGLKETLTTVFGKTISGKNLAAFDDYSSALVRIASAQERVAQTDDKLTQASVIINTAIDENSTSVEKAAIYNNALSNSELANTQAKEANIAATTAYTAIEGLSNEQKEQMFLLNQNGLSSDLALIAAKKGLTQEELKKLAVQALGQEYTEEELKNKMKEIILSKMSVAEKIKLKLATLQSNIVQQSKLALDKQEEASIYGKIVAWMTEKLAIEATTAATITMIATTAIIIGLVALLVGGIVALTKAAKENSLEYKMEQAAEATKRAEIAANAAKDAYEDLLSSKEEFTQLQDTLEDLTYGTLEWKKALVDANQQVLELLKTYPTLAQYITKNDQGILSISEEGWNSLLEIKMQTVENSQNALMISQYQEHQLSKPIMEQIVVEKKDSAALSNVQAAAYNTEDLASSLMRLFNPEVYEQTMSAISTGVAASGSAVNVTKELLKALGNGQDILNKDSAIYLELREKTELTADEILEYATNLQLVETEIEQFSNQSAIYAQQIGGSTKEISNLEEGDDLAWILGQRFTEQYDELYAEIEPSIPDDYESAVKEYAEALGVSIDYIKEQYTKEDFKKLKKDLGNFKVSELINEKSKEFAETWSNFGEEAQKNISALLSYSGESLTQAQMDAFDRALNKQEYLDSLGITEENVSLFGYNTITDMIAAIEANIITATLAFEDSKEEFTGLMQGLETTWGGGIWKDFTDNMTAGAAKSFNELLSTIMVDMGAEGVSSYLNLADSIMEKLSAGGQKKFLEGLSLINLEDIENAEDLREALDGIGISAIELTDKELKELNEEIQAMAAVASRTIVDLADAEKAISAGINSKKILQEAIDNNEFEFSEEDYETLKAAGASTEDFFYDGETYTYLGDTVDLLQQIKADTDVMRQKMLAQVEQNTMEGAAIADWIAKDEDGLIKVGNKEYTRESLITSALEGEAIEGYDAVTLMQEIFGVDTTGWNETYARAQLQSRYDNYGLGGTTYSENLSTLETYYDEQFGAIAADQTGIENVQMYEDAVKEYEKYQRILDSGNELTEEQTILMVKAEKQMKKSTQALEKKEKALNITEEETEGLTEAERGQLVVEKQLEVNLAKAKEETQDYFDTLADGATGIEKDNALTGLVQAADQYLGLELSKEWLEDAENLQAFKEAINGTKEDFYKFISQLDTKTQNAFLGIKTLPEEIQQAFADAKTETQIQSNEMANIVNQLDNLSFDIDGTADFTQIYNAIYAVTQDATSAAKILEQLAGTGVTFDVTYTTVEVEGYAAAQALSAETGGSVYNNRRGTETLYFVRVPKITGRLTGEGISDYSSSSVGGGSSGGSGGGSSDKYESDTDKFHNTQKDIEDEQRKRNDLEKEFAELLEDENATLDEIQEKSEAIATSVERENELHQDIIDGRKQQIMDEFATNDVLNKYAYYDKETGTIKYKKDKNGNNLIDSVTDPEVGEKFDEGWDKVTSWSEDIIDREETIKDNNEIIAEYREVGKNDLDDSFDTLEKIERIENELTNLEAERNLLMENTAANAQAILDSYAKEKELLEQQLATQQQLNKERIAQHNQNLTDAQAAGVMDYITDLGNGQFSVDQEWLDSQNQEIQDWILNWLDKLNESGDAVQETPEAVNDAEQALIDFKNNLQEEAVDFFNQVKEALIESYQRQIDNLSEINDSINDSNSDILAAIQESIDRQRQERDNAETEQDISEKEQKLAYLQMDTSGANQLAIQELQKEIAEDKRSYTDALIDQKISALEEQNSKAFEQRQAQIEIMQSQLEYMQQTGKINTQVQDLIQNGIGLDGKIQANSALYKLLENTADYDGMTATEQKEYWNDYQTAATAYMAYLTGSKVGEKGSNYELGQDITSEFSGLPSGATATVTQGGIKIKMADGTEFTAHGVVEDLLGNLNFSLLTGQTGYFKAADARKALRAADGLDTLTEEEQLKYDVNNDEKITAADARLILRNAAQLDVVDFGPNRYGESDFFNALTLIESGGYDESYNLSKDGKLDDKDLQLIVDNFGMPKSKFAFATGGLANFTGPAWLDGTKSKPEMVLNARDTENFIQLKDILSSVLKNLGSNKTDGKTGDIYYEIHIDVEKLTSDYDVDDVAKRVQQIITADANYRNVNLINRLR